MLCHPLPPSDVLSVKKCLGVNATPSRAERYAAVGPDTIKSMLLCRNMSIHSRYSYFIVHHDRPIAVLSLDHRQGHEKLSRKSGNCCTRGCMTSDIALCVRPNASGRLAHFRSFPSSCISVANSAATADAVLLTDPPRNVPARVWHDPAASN
jgi:hypothetical protein